MPQLVEGLRCMINLLHPADILQGRLFHACHCNRHLLDPGELLLIRRRHLGQGLCGGSYLVRQRPD